VRFETFSRPACRLIELSGPVGCVLKERVSRGYLKALRRDVDAGGQRGGSSR
jgi:uncharacterized protein (UPF0548 family)